MRVRFDIDSCADIGTARGFRHDKPWDAASFSRLAQEIEQAADDGSLAGLRVWRLSVAYPDDGGTMLEVGFDLDGLPRMEVATRLNGRFGAGVEWLIARFVRTDIIERLRRWI